MSSPLTSFVNHARNIVWISGVFHRIDSQTGIVCNSSDLTRGIHVSLKSGQYIPKDGELTECMCHAYGLFDKEANTRSLRLTAFYFKRPNLQNAPAKMKLQVFTPDNPLASLSDIKENIRRTFIEGMGGDLDSNDAADIANLLAKSVMGRENGGFTNKAIITGL